MPHLEMTSGKRYADFGGRLGPTVVGRAKRRREYVEIRVNAISLAYSPGGTPTTRLNRRLM